MSFKKSVESSLDNIIMNFIGEISSKFNLNPDELLSIWEGSPSVCKTTEFSQAELDKKKKADIVEICKSLKLKVSGTKQELINLILSGKPSTSKKPEKPVVSKPSIDKPVMNKSVLNIIKEQQKPISLKKNKFGNYEYENTGLIFDMSLKKVKGTQNPNGSVDELTVESINECNKYKFLYITPLNLDKSKDDADEELDEIIESDEEDENDNEEEIKEEELIEDDDSEADENESGNEYYEEDD